MKFLKLFLVLTFVMSLTACGGSEDTTPAPEATTETETPSETSPEAMTDTSSNTALPGEEPSDIMDLGLDNARAELDLVE